jgi:hypothetical protein
MTARKRLPNRRHAETFELTVGGLRYVCTVGRFVDGRIGELFLSNHKIKQQIRTRATRPPKLHQLHHFVPPRVEGDAMHLQRVGFNHPPLQALHHRRVG